MGSDADSERGPLFLEPDFSQPATAAAVRAQITGQAFVNPDVGMTFTVNESVATQRLWVPRGAAISVFTSLSVSATGRYLNFQVGGANADFSDSFHFNPDEVFTIYTEGVTVDAPSMGIIDNQLPISPVPEPATTAMMLLGLGGLAALQSRRRSRRADPA